MQNDNYKKIKSLFYIVAIISMVIAIFNKVKADSIPNYIQEYYSSYIDEATNISLENKQEVKNYIASFAYSFMAEFYTNDSVYERVIYLTNYSDMGFCSWYGWNGYANTYFNGTRCSNSRWNDGGITLPNNISSSSASFSAVIIIYSGTTVELRCNKYTPSENIQKSSYSVWLYFNHSYSRAINSIPYYSDWSTPYNYSSHNNVNNVKCYLYEGSDDFKYFYSSEYDRFSGITALKGLSNIEYFEAPPSVSTNGFSVFKYNNMGQDTIRFVPNGLVTVGSHYSNNPSLTFDLVIDDVTIPCSYNESSGFYYESLVYNKAFFEIPVSNFMPSSLDDFDNVYITNVVYVNEWSNPSESSTDTFYYVDKCWLKRDVTNEDVGQVSITHVDTDTGYDSTVLNNIFQMITDASTLQGEFDEEKNLVGGSTNPISFSSFQDAVVKEIECWHPTGTKDSDWVSITIDGVTYDSGDNMYWLEYNNTNQQSFEHRYNYNISPYSYVRENNYSGYYDILYFIVHENIYDSSGSGFSTLSNSYTRYYYFISDRYYTKLMLYREMDIMEYIKLGNEGQEKIYNYLYDRLLNIDDNLYYYIKDKADIDNQILDAIESFDNSIEFALDDVLRVLNTILDALLNLNIQVPEVDLSDIQSSLDSIDNSLKNNEIDTVEECIKYFEENNNNGYPTSNVFEENRFSVWMSGKVHKWMQGSEPNIHIFRSSKIVDVFNTITNIYDSVIGGSNGFYITQYLDIISGADDGQSYHGYFNGMFESNFDVTSYEGVTVE